MTIVCAQRIGASVWIGSDSMAAANDFVYPAPMQKWYRYAGWWFGFCGSARLFYLLSQDGAETPTTIDGWCLRLRKLVIDDGWKPDEGTGIPPAYGQNQIVVSPALDAYEISTGFTPTAFGEEFCALGSGEPYAYGAAFAAAATHEHPGTVMHRAIEAACKYSLTCAPPIFVKEITNDQA